MNVRTLEVKAYSSAVDLDIRNTSPCTLDSVFRTLGESPVRLQNRLSELLVLLTESFESLKSRLCNRLRILAKLSGRQLLRQLVLSFLCVNVHCRHRLSVLQAYILCRIFFRMPLRYQRLSAHILTFPHKQ